MKIATMMAAWERPSLTDIVVRYYEKLKIPGIQFVNYVAISPEDRYFEYLFTSAEDSGANVVLIPNKPLCEKWNALLRACRGCDPDAILVLGSDNLVSKGFIHDAVSSLVVYDYCQSDWIYFYHIMKERLILRHLDQNGIKLFSREAVDKMEWQLWRDQPRAMAMDKAMDLHIDGSLSVYHMNKNKNRAVLDIKGAGPSRVAFWQYEKNLQGEEVDALDFFERHFTRQYDEICRLVGQTSS